MQQHNHEKTKRFISTFTQNPPQFDTFTTTLKDVLDGEEKIIELKYAAKKTSSLVEGWVDFCNDIGFYAFHKYLADVFENWQPVITYIRNMSSDFRTKSIRDLKGLWLQCNRYINIPQAINVCYEIQNEITQILSNKFTDTTKDRKQDIFEGKEKIFGSDTFTESIIEQGIQEENDAAFYHAFWTAIHKNYHFTSKGVPVPKYLFKPPKERSSDPSENR